ncbi:MAG: hypothetical protein Q7Q71_14645 [Verrucomicrobiota bacterium JB023]|nr:hypothetical protein [Verrucomicrobiota bacterium JB023]
MPIIQCRPKGFFSWGYTLTGASWTARSELDVFGESGSLLIEGQRFEVKKQGFLSGEWQVWQGNEHLLGAHKSNPLTRRFRIKSAAGHHILQPAGLGRTMTLSGPGHRLKIAPNHPFTRKATITGEGDNPLVITFSFWLSSLVWRRAANNAAN